MAGVVGLAQNGSLAFKNAEFGAPVHVAAVEGDGSATLSWKMGTLEQPSVTGYRVESAPAGTSDWTGRNRVDTRSTSTTAEVVGTSDFTARRLQFRIAALTGGLASPPSSPSVPVVLGAADQLRSGSRGPWSTT